MQKIEFARNEHKRYWISQYSKIKIPLPSLNVQKAIVAEIEGHRKKIANYQNEIAECEQEIQDKIAEVWGEK